MINPTAADIGRRVVYTKNNNSRQYINGQWILLLSDNPITTEGFVHSFNNDYVHVQMYNWVSPKTSNPRPILRWQLEWA